MKLRYIFKEAKYYRKLDGSLKRAFYKFLFSKTPLSKIVNTKSYNHFYKKRIERFTKEHNPVNLQIENTNLCNAKCIMCPHGIMKRKKKTMNQKDFEKMVKRVLKEYPNIRLLTITGFGEPLMDRELVKKIDFLNKNYPELWIDIYTNASLLDKKLSEKLLKKKIHKIHIAINAMEKNYKKITGLDYKKVKENVLYFVERKKELEKEFPLINFSLMILKENKKDIDDFIKLWSSYGDSVMTYRPLEWAGDKKIEAAEKPPFKKKRWPCIPLWQNITIDVDGNIIMCCQDYESKVKFGNILKQPIKQIMNNPEFKKIREMHKNGNYSMDICKTCDNWINSSLWWWVYN